MGGWLGIDLLASDTASYDPAEGEITMSAAPQWADGRVIAIAVVLQLLLIVAISYRYGGSLLRPLLFGGAALLAYLFVSFPFSTGLCYTIILFGLARQYVGALASEELRRDMDGFVDTLLTRPRGVAAASGSGAALEELRASRNPLARLFPFKVQELFLIYDDGRLISHSTLHGSRTVDSEIVSSMLTAIGDFIKDSFRADDKASLENLKYGNINLYVQRREPLYLAGVISGTAPDDFGVVMKEYLDELWGEYGYVIGRSWNGDTSSFSEVVAGMAASRRSMIRCRTICAPAGRVSWLRSTWPNPATRTPCPCCRTSKTASAAPPTPATTSGWRSSTVGKRIPAAPRWIASAA